MFFSSSFPILPHDDTFDISPLPSIITITGLRTFILTGATVLETWEAALPSGFRLDFL